MKEKTFDKLKIKKYLTIIMAIALPALALFFYYAFYNEDNLGGIQCTFFNQTGLLCPGCGGQRAMHSLLHGNLIEAIRFNALLVFGLPLATYLYYAILKAFMSGNKKYIRSVVFSPLFGLILFFVIVAYTILRNI